MTTIDGNAVAAAERLAGSEEQARRAGARAGLLGDGHPQGFERLPSEVQWAFSESYTQGRHTARVADGKEHVAAGAMSIPAYATTREQLVAEFQRRADLQQEFLSEAAFVAFAMAERSGKLRILRRPDASTAA
ncbi:hypothetical protein [Methylocystis suflitae]|uniref:hypothetical protein n=1 Tax=Methylocystis suflitae TaxID=2951405 RepID=UPI00210CE503|nr:hypothetical protein [Methylocystis suflitae]MCQ4188118.1 hypothetical protein [Methylocystis suflitae]